MSYSNYRNKFPILFLGSQMTTAGAQQVLFMQAHWFHERGYQVTVAFFYDRDGLHQKWQGSSPFPIINLKAWQKNSPFLNGFRLMRGLLILYQLLLSEKFSVIESFTHHSNLLGMPLAWIANIPVRIATHHGGAQGFPKWINWVHKLIINQGIATKMVAVSEQVRQQALDLEEIQPEHISVIPNGIDIPLRTTIDKKEHVQLRQSLGIMKEDLMVLTVGSLSKPKGHVFLLEAIPEILESNPNTVFTFAGEGQLREELEARVKDLRITKATRFLGIRSDIPDLLNIADCFVLPSLWEGLPLALLEAMATGLPVVATKVGGIEEIIRDGYNGLLVPSRNSQALSQSIKLMLSNENLRKRLGIAGKELVKEKYTIDRMCEQYELLFQHSLEIT